MSICLVPDCNNETATFLCPEHAREQQGNSKRATKLADRQRAEIVAYRKSYTDSSIARVYGCTRENVRTLSENQPVEIDLETLPRLKDGVIRAEHKHAEAKFLYSCGERVETIAERLDMNVAWVVRSVGHVERYEDFGWLTKALKSKSKYGADRNFIGQVKK